MLRATLTLLHNKEGRGWQQPLNYKMRAELLGAYYESKQRDIQSYLRKHCYSQARIKDVCRHTNLSRQEVEHIVNTEGSDLTIKYNGDYIQKR